MTQISRTASYLQHHSADSIKTEKIGGLSLGLRGDEASTVSVRTQSKSASLLLFSRGTIVSVSLVVYCIDLVVEFKVFYI